MSIVVADATCLERNLNLILQTLEITNRVVVCLNLMDQANRNGIHINTKKLSSLLGVPVIETTARAGKGLQALMEAVDAACEKSIVSKGYQVRYHAQIERALEILQPCLEKLLGQKMNARWMALRLLEGEESLLSTAEKKLGFSLLENEEIQSKLIEARAALGEENYRDRLVADITAAADFIYHSCVRLEKRGYHERDGKILNGSQLESVGVHKLRHSQSGGKLGKLSRLYTQSPHPQPGMRAFYIRCKKDSRYQ